MYQVWYIDGMTDQHIPTDLVQRMGRVLRPAPTPAEVVTERIETRRATLQARLPDAPPVPDNVCDGWGVVPVLASDGSGYEPAACLGCASCSMVRPTTAARSAQAMAAMMRDVADDEPM